MVNAATYLQWDHPSPMLDRLGDLRRHPSDARRFGFVVDEGAVSEIHHGNRLAVARAEFDVAGRRIAFAVATFMPAPGNSRKD